MDDKSAADILAALSHEARLRTFRLLVQAGNEGLNVGEIARHFDMPISTLAHHLKMLTDVGLLTQERRGREVINCADYETMRTLIDFLTESCCDGVSLVAAR